MQEITTDSWFSRMKNAFFGIIIGVILLIASFPVLIWNEGNSVKVAKALQAAQEMVVNVKPSPVNPENNGKLIHFSGDATTQDILHDNVFDVSGNVLKLNRVVEMYQWEEDSSSKTEKKVGGSTQTVTNYTYKKVWSPNLIDSSGFKEKGHNNPAAMPINGRTQVARDVTVGDFTIPTDLVRQLDNTTPVDISKVKLSESNFDNLPVARLDDYFYVGDNPRQPAIGDMKISFTEVLPGPVSIMGEQNGDTIQAYLVNGNHEIELITSGTESSDQMIAAEKKANAIFTWVMRLVGFLMMLFGVVLILNPLAVLGDVIPFIGSILEAGIFIIAFAFALVFSGLTIGLSWIAFRPVWGVIIIVVACIIGYAIVHYRKRRKARKANNKPAPKGK